MLRLNRVRPRFVNCADECTGNGELEHITDATHQEDLRRQRFDRKPDEVQPDANKPNENPHAHAGADTPTAMTGVQHRQEERHDDMAENKRRPNHVVVGAVVGLDFHVGGLHQNAVPDEAEEKDEYERSNKCDEKFTPVHERGFKPMRSSLSMQKLIIAASQAGVRNQ